jgi:hypothetical protein
MATRWEYSAVEDFRQSGETKIQSMLRELNASGREGWEFDQTIDSPEDGKFYLLFRRARSN